MHHQISGESKQEDLITKFQTANTEKREDSKRTEMQNNSNRNIIYPKTEQPPTQEKKMNVEIIKRMTSE